MYFCRELFLCSFWSFGNLLDDITDESKGGGWRKRRVSDLVRMHLSEMWHTRM